MGKVARSCRAQCARVLRRTWCHGIVEVVSAVRNNAWQSNIFVDMLRRMININSSLNVVSCHGSNGANQNIPMALITQRNSTL